MTTLLTGLVAVLVFGGMILVHEGGHFVAAKKFGIQVVEFAIGMGPVIWSKTIGTTQYSLRLLPIGGYNQMLSREEEELERAEAEKHPEDAPAPATPESYPGKYFEDASLWQRAVVLIAGPLMNFLLGFLLLLVIFANQELIGTKQIAEVEEGSSAAQSGLMQGDVILSVNGRSCLVYDDIFYELERTQNASADFVVKRDGKKIKLNDVKFDEVTTEDGYTYLDIGFKVRALKKTPLSVLKTAAVYTLYYAKYIFGTLVDLAAGRESINNLSGPVGIVDAIHTAVTIGWDRVAMLAMIITINLGVFNLLPVPALDGGQLMYLAAEAILRRPLPVRLRTALNAVGMALLLGIAFFATYQDILRMI